MILPIVTYDHPVLLQKAAPVQALDEALLQLIDDMFETMYQASGVGLAAPQIGRAIRLFVVDADPMLPENDTQTVRYGKKVFINPELLSFSQTMVAMDEGCLSLPDLRESVIRPDALTIRYRDAEWKQQTMEVNHWMARVIQHEFDHLDGILFFDRLGSFKRRLLKSKLDTIAAGQYHTDYLTMAKS
jgi:peptide deformylase